MSGAAGVSSQFGNCANAVRYDVRERRGRYVMATLFATALAALLFSVTVGRYAIPLNEVAGILRSLVDGRDTTSSLVFFRVRLPRALSAFIIGASLASAGAAYQGVFRNPMASPDILGASAGAAFGAALGLMLGWSVVWVQSLSFATGMAAVGFACLVGWRARNSGDGALSLILSGILVGSLFTALLSFVKYVADPYNTLPAITFWLMGSLASVQSNDLSFLAIPALGGFLPLLLLRWRLNLLSLGDDEASALGVNAPRLRLAVVTCATLITTSSVAVVGMIGWVGLVMPHIARSVVGPDYRYLLPASAISGGIFLVMTDCAARNALAAEVPLGLLSSLIGLPFFLFMLNRTKARWA